MRVMLGLAMVLGLAHFTFCQPTEARIPASPHFTHKSRTLYQVHRPKASFTLEIYYEISFEIYVN